MCLAAQIVELFLFELELECAPGVQIKLWLQILQDELFLLAASDHLQLEGLSGRAVQWQRSVSQSSDRWTMLR